VTPPISTVIELKSVVAAGLPKLTPVKVPVLEVPKLTPGGVPTVTEAEGPRETFEITLPLAEDTVKLLVLTLAVPAAGAVRETGVKLTAETEVVETPESITKLLPAPTVTVRFVPKVPEVPKLVKAALN
jgi:hypothetical protein